MRTLIILFSFFCFYNSLAQNPVYFNYNQSNGLAEDEVYSMFIDKNQFLWISSAGGLQKFSGNQFVSYKNQAQRSESFGEVHQDGFGRIWVQNFAGQYFYIQNDSLHLFYLKGVTDKLYFNSYLDFDDQNNLLLFNQLGFFKIGYKNLDQDGFPIYNQLLYSKEGIAQMSFKDSKNNYWFEFFNIDGSEPAIAKWDNHKISIFEYDKKVVINLLNVRFAFEWQNELYFFQRQQNHLFKFNGKYFIYVSQLTQTPPLIRVNVINNNLVFQTAKGFCITNNLFSKHRMQLQSNLVSMYKEDKSNNVWISTLRNGIFFQFNKYLNKVFENKVSKGEISTFTNGPKAGFVLGTTLGELGLLNKQYKYKKIFQNKLDPAEIIYIKYIPILNKIFWSSTFVNVSNIKNNKTIFCTGIRSSLKDLIYIPQIKSIYSATSRLTILNSINQDIDSKTINLQNSWRKKYVASININPLHKNIDSFLIFDEKRSRAVWYDSLKNIFWSANVSGLNLYSENEKKEIYFNNKPINGTSIIENKDTIWIGTIADGILAIKNNKVVKNINVTNGLKNNGVLKIKKEGPYLWAQTQSGIEYYNVNNKSSALLSTATFPIGSKIITFEIQRDSVFILTSNGIFSYPINPVQNNLINTSIFINTINIHSDLLVKNQSSRNIIAFQLQVPIYNERQNFYYKYKLQNVDEEFLVREINSDIFQYHNLSPGEYKLVVYLANYKGNVSKKPFEHTFYINPFWYQTVWFKLGLILIGFLFIYFIYLYRLNLHKKRNEELLAIESLNANLRQSQLKGIKAQMNPHFLFNSLNTIQSYILKNEKSKASVYLGKFSNLIRKVLNQSEEEYISLFSEIETLTIYLELEKMRFENVLEYEIVQSENLNKELSYIPSMIIQPFIENALKHGLIHKKENRKLLIQISNEANSKEIVCTIEDNGIGREASARMNKFKLQHQSFASEATIKRIQLLNQGKKSKIEVEIIDLKDSHQEPIGTKVILKIPVQ